MLWKQMLLAAVVLSFLSIAHAQNLTITVAQNTTAGFVNSRTNHSVLNFTVVSDNAHVNITSLNITLRGTANGTDIAKVFVFNGSVSGLLLGSNTSISPNLTTDQNVSVSFSTPLLLLNRNQTVIVVVYEIASGAVRGRTAGGEIKTVGALSANHTVVANVSLPNTTLSQIQDLHANATISPRFADTSVINQSLVYILGITGADNLNNITISFPSGYTLVNLTAVERGGSNLTAGTDYTNTTLANQINITLNNPTTQNIKIYFTVNTSSSGVVTSAFTSTIGGSNLSNVATDATTLGINVTTQQILNLTNVTITKSTAIVNGTDFWEFNLTLNYTANISSGGLIQFKLTNWNTTSGSPINITDSQCPGSRCATLRNEVAFNTTGKFNVTNDYETLTKGLSVSSTTQGNLVTVILRMIIPSGTPASAGWQATYGILFRASP